MHSSLVLETWFAWHSIPRIGKLVILNIIAKVIDPLMASELTRVHDVVSADGTVINVDVYKGQYLREGAYPKPRGPLRSTS